MAQLSKNTSVYHSLDNPNNVDNFYIVGYDERRRPELVALTGCLSDRWFLDRKEGKFNCSGISKRDMAQLVDQLETRIKSN
jgi:hypothetical protein